jgi:alkaline phosphatase D
MKTVIAFTLPLVLLAISFSCKKDPALKKEFKEPVSILYDSSLKPFYHSVASGDPLPDRVVIWTRVTPDDSVASIPVRWEVSEDENFSSILLHNTTSTTPQRDYTVKVDVGNLQPGKHYYYRFTALGKTSPAGRTKTTPADPKDSLRFAVVSCSNWEWGYFNAYDRIAEKEVDAVIHLGDYIYEYASGRYGDTTIGRTNLPPHEIVSLQDYRTRYSQYHLDQGLRHARQRHPFITIWDDHEVANNVYTGGAQNHQAEEGDFNQRKAAARQAYYEWLPIREGHKHYRSFSFGNLADLIMLDERLEGRTKPVDSVSSTDYHKENRSMLGPEQLAWFEDQMSTSKATWKIIGNQVIFSDLYPQNLDAWDGYPAEKKRIVESIRTNNLKNIVFITGDTHGSWAIEAATDIKRTYKPKISQGAFAVELGTTSVSSANGDEYKSVDSVKAAEQALLRGNPHIKYFNDRDHGYLLLTLYPHKAKAEWWYVATLRRIDDQETLGKKFEITAGKNTLQ